MVELVQFAADSYKIWVHAGAGRSANYTTSWELEFHSRKETTKRRVDNRGFYLGVFHINHPFDKFRLLPQGLFDVITSVNIVAEVSCKMFVFPIGSEYDPTGGKWLELLHPANLAKSKE